jgi:heme/copper-type cytochrome/quinol oxidase subunit 2
MGGLGLVGLWLFLVVVIAVSILLAVGSIWLAHRSKLADSVGREENSALSPFLTCVALVFGALLGFTVVVAWEQFSSAETHVANEASTLTTMYRQTVAMPVPERTQMRELLRKYTTAAQGPEWAQQESGGGTSDSARAAITQMYRVLGGQPPGQASSVTGEFLVS